MGTLPAFRNEPYTDFSRPENREAMKQALAGVRAEFGREYELWIDGERVKTEQKLESRNPSRPAGIVGVHQRATPELARQAVEAAYSFFPEWSRVPAQDRAAALLRAAAILRRRKLEFDAWLVYEAGKTWISGWASRPALSRKRCRAVPSCACSARVRSDLPRRAKTTS